MAVSEKNLGYAFEAIDNIRTNLERYKIQNNNGFPILKELIQNANDAEATELIIKTFPGDIKATHELLRNVGILVYNNGPFNESNERAMRTIGGSDKKDDVGKIGKYGLGMKSIYHICDFFFYIKDGTEVDFINPWYKSDNPNYIHKEWSELQEGDKKIILDALPKNAKKEGLTILIPGKSNYDAENEKLHISSGNSVDMNFPFGTGKEELIKNLTVCLSLLQEASAKGKKHLEEIRYEISDSDKFIIKANGKKEITGDATAKYTFYSETKLADESKNELFVALDSKKLIGDKIVENENIRRCTLELVRTPKIKEFAVLNVKFCVLLPLQDMEEKESGKIEQKLEYKINSNFDYTLLINAPFMIDHGRQGILEYDYLTVGVDDLDIKKVTNKDSASGCWNRLISQNIVFPSLPKLFENALNDKICTSNEMTEFLSALNQLSKRDKNVINTYTTQKYGFAKTYIQSWGKLNAEWKLLDLTGEEANFLFIPESSPENIKKIFPTLTSNKETTFVVGNSKSSYLLPNEYNPNIEVVHELIENLPKESITNRVLIDILRNFIFSLANEFGKNENLSKKVISKIRQLLSECELEELSAVNSALKDLFELINQITISRYKIFAVDNRERKNLKIPASDWQKMWMQETDFILVPRFINIHNLTEEEILQELILGTESDRSRSICAFLIRNNFSGETQNTILSGLISLRTYIKEIIKYFPDITIFGLVNVKTQNQIEYKNSRECEQILNSKCLFTALGVIKKEDPVFLYSNLFSEDKIYALYTKSDIEDFGLDENERKLILENNTECILDSFANQKNYESLFYVESYKAPFVNELLRHSFDVKESDANFYRFLLAGFKVVAPNQVIQVYASECDSDWKKIYERCKIDDNVVIPREYKNCIEFINLNKEILNIEFINNRVCFEQLNAYSWNHSLTFLLEDPVLCSEGFIEKILKEITSERYKTLFWKLPIHRDFLTGQILKEIDIDNSYLNIDNINFPSSFSVSQKLIKLDDNEILSEKQKNYVEQNRILTAGKAVKLFLEGKGENDNDYEWIISQLRKAYTNKERSVFDEIKQTVWQIKWIPTKNNQNSALNEIIPNDIFSLETVENICDITNLYKLNDLKISTDDEKFLKKCSLLPDTMQEVFNIIKNKIQQNPIFVSIESSDELAIFSKILANKSTYPIFYIINLLYEDKKINNKNIIYSDFYKKLGSISGTEKQYIDLLKYLNNKEITPYVLDLFSKVLSICVERKCIDLKEILLPTVSNKWKKASEITRFNATTIISDDYKLNERISMLLNEMIDVEMSVSEKKGSIHSIKSISSDSQLEEIKQFFVSWISKDTTKELIYLLLFLLRDNFRELVRSMDLGVFTKIQNYLFNNFKILEGSKHRGNWKWYYDYNSNEQLFGSTGNMYFTVDIHPSLYEEKSSEVKNLLGEYIMVKLHDSDSFSPITEYPSLGTTYVQMSLITIPDDVNKSDNYIKEVITALLKNCYGQPDSEIERMLNTFENTNQNTIEATARDLLRGMKYILRSLNVQNSEFKDYENKFAEIDDNESIHQYDNDDEKNELEANRKRDELSKRLIERIKKDGQLQTDIFTAIWNKVDINQYYEDSVLFEFFQNADDCVNDLVNCGIELEQKNKQFLVTTSSSLITISHYGRMLNYTPPATTFKYKEKFKYDLRNMMSLYSSDKEKNGSSENIIGDTGKFGLGFKSVYKICEEPIIRSGKLEFKIIAGIYPTTKGVEPSETFSSTSGETRFELNDSYSDQLLSKIEGRFKKAIPFLLLFSKQIKEIIFNKEPYSIKPTLDNHKQNTNGYIDFITIDNKEYFYVEGFYSDSNKNRKKYTIIFGSVNNQIKNASYDENPKIWNLTPLESVANLPFYINAEFELDTGRRNLAAHSDKNFELLQNISKGFANILCKSKEKISENNFVSIMNLMVNAYNMQSDQLFKPFAKNVLKFLYDELKIIPTGWGTVIHVHDDLQLLSISSTRYGINSDNSETLFRPLQVFLNSISEIYFVVTESAAEILQELSIDIQRTNLESLLYIITDNKISSDLLESYCAIAKIVKNFDLFNNVDFSRIKLLNKTGDWISCTKIILLEDAPLELQLNDGYSDNIKSILLNNPLFSKNIAHYQSKKNEKLQALLASLHGISGSNIPDNDQDYNESEDTESFNSELTESVQDIYNWWHSLGEEGQKIEAQKYYSDMLPSEFHYENFTFVHKGDSEEDILQFKYEWFVLFFLGVYQCIGFKDADIKNSQFIKQISEFKDGNMLYKLSEKRPSSNKDTWIDLITDFSKIDNQAYNEKYFHWLTPIPKLIKVWEYESIYRSIFTKLDLSPEAQNSIQTILSPEAINALSGSGFGYAPTLQRTLRIGSSLIIRELLMKKVITPVDFVVQHAYMPKQGIVQYVCNLQGYDYTKTSVHIYNKLLEIFDGDKQRATFDGYYDIPLLIKIYG